MSDIFSRLSAALADRYRVERELGGGGMSRVFLAEELGLGRKVVVKLLPPDLGAAVNADRFRREIHLAASLQHPHIVPLLAAGSAGGLLYYTMPLIEGESLRARLARAGELPVAEAVRLLRDVADALAYAHDRSVLHRDIKPDNILLSRQHALVTDFGVAKALAASQDLSEVTSAGVALGTPAYMAPEQASADPHTDHRADLYALGVVAYEMLTGTTLFPGLTGQAALAAQATRRPTPIIELRPSIPAALAALVMRCLEKHPADRPQSANEIMQQLDTESTPIGGTAPTLAMPAHRPAVGSRRRLVVVAAAVLTALLLAGIVLRRPRNTESLDENLLAVAPFDVLGSGLDLWREGLVDLLSRNLDGAGPLRTVSPTLVVRRWKGRADPLSAGNLGRSTGAGLVAIGNLIATTPDSVRITAAILDVRRSRTVAEVELRGRGDRMDQLADSLTVGLLRDLGRTRDLVAVRTATLGATSLPALKAFLEGERLYRAGRWDSAQAAYRQSLSHDSLFVPALRHLALSLSWRSGSDEYVSYMLRAGSSNHGLSPRDSILVAGDSLMAAVQLPNNLPLSVYRKLRDRLFETLGEATRRYPGDPEAWYALGEASYHSGWPRVVDDGEILEPFERAIELDSNFTPAYVHATDLGLVTQGLEGWRRYAKPYLRLRPTDDFETGTRLLDAILESQRPAEIDSLLGSARPNELVQALFAVWKYPDSAETAVRIAGALAASRRHAGGFFDDPGFRRDMLTNILAYRGHLARAESRLDEQSGWTASLPAEIAFVSKRDSLAVDSRFRRLLRNGAVWQPGQIPAAGLPGLLFYAQRWWTDRRDTLALATYVRRVDSAHQTLKDPQQRAMTQYMLDASQAYRILSRGDTAAALQRFESLPHDFIWGVMERVTEGQLLVSQARDREAVTVLEHAFPYNWASPMRVLIQLRIGQAAERLHDRERAIRYYQRFGDTWQHADPELQHYVDEARQGLARVTSESNQ